MGHGFVPESPGFGIEPGVREKDLPDYANRASSDASSALSAGQMCEGGAHVETCVCVLCACVCGYVNVCVKGVCVCGGGGVHGRH